MSFPLFYLLIVYGALFAVWLFLFGAAVFHMYRFAVKGWFTHATVLVFCSVALFLVLASALFFLSIDWSYPVNFFNRHFNSPLSL